MKKILLTGGGTAGHVTPNIALLPGLKDMGFDIHYVGTRGGMERGLIAKTGLPYHCISAGKMRRYFDLKNFTDLFKIALGFFQALVLMVKLRPAALFSKGGFVSCPVVWAAWLFRVPVVIHESDITPGLANKLSMPFAKKICFSFPETERHLPRRKRVMTGLPVRAELFGGDAAHGRALCGFDNDLPVITVIGGSLGAQAINKVVRGALDKLIDNYNVCHICGKDGKAPGTRKGYCQFEYVGEELPHLFAMSSMVISRAGATTLFELLALRKPALLIPLGTAASRGDQILNAKSFESQNYARVLLQDSLTPASLAEAVDNFYNERESCVAAMAGAEADKGAKRVIETIGKLTGITPPPRSGHIETTASSPLTVVAAAVFAMIITILPATTSNASPIPLTDHSFRSFDRGRHYRLDRPSVIEPLDVHDLSLQFSNRYYYSNDTSQVNNRWLLLFADSINFRDIDFNFRIRVDGLGERASDAGWSSKRAGDANDPGFLYDPDRIVAHYTPSEHFRFGFGKDRYNWGPLELGGLMLSDYNQGFTGFYQQYALGGFVLRGLTAQMNSLNLSGNPDMITHRYFSAARLEYRKPDYGVSIGQSIVYSGVGRSIELRYLFPFYIYHYGQMTDDHGYANDGHNTMGSIDGYAKIYKLPLEIYGELLVDDFQGHSDDVSQSVQNAVSWMVGLRLKGAQPWYGFAEGGKISTYTYNHIAPQMHYTIGSESLGNRNFIGSPLGPDQQLVWGKFGRTFDIPTRGGNDTLGADLNFWLRRSGERHGRDTMFNIGSFDTYRGSRDDPQPFYREGESAVENEMALWASIAYRKYHVDLELRGGATLYKNRGNAISDKWESHPFFGVFLTSGLSSSAAKSRNQ